MVGEINMTNFEIGKVLKVTMPKDENKYVLVMIINGRISYYTGFEDLDGLTLSFSERYTGDSDEKIIERVNYLYKAQQFHWAWHTWNGTRVEEELLERYLSENKDPEIIFDEWVEENCDIDNLVGGNQ